jgi:hypothetical protein
MPRLECKLEHPKAQYPRRKRVTDAGYDVFSVEEVVIPAHSGRTEKISVLDYFVGAVEVEVPAHVGRSRSPSV